MNDYREPEILFPSSISKNPSEISEYHLFIISCFLAGLIGILTIAYTAFQWRRNINLSWMKAIARSKKNPKAKNKVPVAPHAWMLESVSRGKCLNCCVCLKSVSPSQALGPMASETFIHCCSICGAAAHLGCSSNAHKDCKSIVKNRAVGPSLGNLPYGVACGVNGWYMLTGYFSRRAPPLVTRDFRERARNRDQRRLPSFFFLTNQRPMLCSPSSTNQRLKLTLKTTAICMIFQFSFDFKLPIAASGRRLLQL